MAVRASVRYGHLFASAEEDVSMFEKLEQDLMAAWELRAAIGFTQCRWRISKAPLTLSLFGFGPAQHERM